MFNSINPKSVKRYKTKVFSKFIWIDILVLGIAIILSLIFFVLIANWIPKLIVIFMIFTVAIILLLPVSIHPNLRVYGYIWRWLLFLTSKKKFKLKEGKKLIPYSSIDNGLINLKGPGIIEIIKISGFNIMTLTPDESHQILESYRSFLREMGVTYTLAALDITTPLDKRLEYLESIKTSANSYHISVNRKIIENLREKNKNVERQYFIFIYSSPIKADEIIRRMMSSLGMANLSVAKTTDVEKLFILSRFYGKKSVSNITDLVSTNVRYTKSHIEINNKLLRIYAIDEYPQISSLGWLYPISQIPNVSFVMNIEGYNTTKAAKKLDKIISNIRVDMVGVKKHSQTSKSDREYDLMIELSHLVNQDSEKISSTYSFLIAEANTKEELKEIHKTLMSAGSANNFKIIKLDFLQFNALNSVMPKRTMDLQKHTSIEVPSSSLANAFPFHQDSLSDDNGLYLGYSQLGSNIFFDNWKLDNQRKNHNMVILGNSGGGKSTLLKKLVKDNWMKGTKVFIIDGQRENEKICKSVGGKWLNLGPDKDSNEKDLKINPLQFFEDEDSNGTLATHLQFLQGFFKSLFPEMTDVMSSMLQEILIKLYERKVLKLIINNGLLSPGDFPIMEELAQLIENEFVSIVSKTNEQYKVNDLYHLKMYFGTFLNKNSPESKMWNGHTNFDTKKSMFYVFDISSLITSQNKRLSNAQMHMLLKFMYSEVIKNRKFNLRQFRFQEKANQNILIVVDEAHLIIDEKAPAGIDFLFTMVKTIRKYSGSMIITTQNISDLMSGGPHVTAKTSAIINNAQYQFYFQMNPDDLAKLNDMNASSSYTFSEEEKNYIVSANKGDCLFMLSQKDRKMIHIDISIEEMKIWKKDNEA